MVKDYVFLLVRSASSSSLSCSLRTSSNIQKLYIKNETINMLAHVPVTVAVIIAVRDQYLFRAVKTLTIVVISPAREFNMAGL